MINDSDALSFEDDGCVHRSRESAAYLLGEPGDDGSYLVEHTASIMLVEPRVRQAALFGRPHDDDDVAARFLEFERAVPATG